MAKLKLLLDTNIVIDFLNERHPFYEGARLMMICGRVGEFDLKITSSQFTDLVYILSDGGKKSKIEFTLKQLRGLRTFIDVIPIDSEDIDLMLNSDWSDPEDFLLYKAAEKNKVDALVSRNKNDFDPDIIPIFNCEELFDWVLKEFDLDYSEIEF